MQELPVDMYEFAVPGYSERLIREGYSPSLYMTNLMIAAVKEFGIIARFEERGFHQEPDHLRERWIPEVGGTFVRTVSGQMAGEDRSGFHRS